MSLAPLLDPASTVVTTAHPASEGCEAGLQLARSPGSVIVAATAELDRASSGPAAALASALRCPLVECRSTKSARRQPTERILAWSRDADRPLVCIAAPCRGWYARRTPTARVATGVLDCFDGPVLLVGRHCAEDWTPRTGPLLAVPSMTSTAYDLLAWAGGLSKALQVDLWLAVVASPAAHVIDADGVARRDLLAAGLLARMSRTIERAGVPAAWDVLFSRDVVSGLRSFKATYSPSLFALEVERPIERHAPSWATALAVAEVAEVPVLVVPTSARPTSEPFRPTPRAPGGTTTSRARPAMMAQGGDRLQPPPATRPVALLREPAAPHHAPCEQVAATPRSRLAIAVAVAVLTAVVAALFGIAQREIPYYSVRPGTTPSLGELVTVRGAPTYTTSGGVRFVTVVTRRTSVIDAIRGWIDPDVDVVPSSLASVEAQQVWNTNRELMEASKEAAVVVALRRLGYSVGEHGSGAAVTALEPDAPAASLLRVGDVIVGIGTRPVEVAQDVAGAIAGAETGQIISIDYRSQGTAAVRQRLVQLEALTNGQPGLGVAVKTIEARYDLPVEIDIDTANVVGPSAGLAICLAVIDALDPGDLTGGVDVAVTGTIDADGAVGLVGSLRHKVMAAQRGGADVLFVPSAQQEQVERLARGRLQVVGVTSLDDALDVLQFLGGDPLTRR